MQFGSGKNTYITVSCKLSRLHLDLSQSQEVGQVYFTNLYSSRQKTSDLKVLKINASPEEILSDGPKSGKINTGCI